MNTPAWVELLAFLAVLLLLAWPLGRWMAAVAEGRLPRWLSPLVRMKHGLYRLAGVDPAAVTGWKPYAVAVLVFNTLGLLAVYALQRLQALLPLNPQALPAVSSDSAFNTAISFASNTNWQGYAGEATMSYLTQMLGLGVQNFLSAATGMAVLYALIRGFEARGSGRVPGQQAPVGNFWVDMKRSTLYGLLPLAIVLATVLVGQGVVPNFSAYKQATTVEAVEYTQSKKDAAGEAIKDAQGAAQLEAVTAKHADAADGPGRIADRHQTAGHQRRWLLQHQLRAPAGEPDAAVQRTAAAGHRADSGGAVLHLR